MRKLAQGIGAVGLTGIAALGCMAAFGGAFGPLNDVCNAIVAGLTAALAWRLEASHGRWAPRAGRPALGAATAGAIAAAVGSVLVIFRFTGWYLAGLVTAVGYALIGSWLLRFSQAALRSAAWPRGLAQLGRAAGALMTLGFLAAPGVVRRVDSPASGPWWVNLGLLGALGWLVLLPTWALWLARWQVAQLRPGGGASAPAGLPVAEPERRARP